MKAASPLRRLPRGRLFGIVLMGLLAGAVNGLLGAGGGILIVYALSFTLRKSDPDPRDMYANALCVMLPVSAFSCLRYAISGHFSTDGFALYTVPAILGGLAGGFLLGRLRAGVLKKLFAALVIYSGIFLIIR